MKRSTTTQGWTRRGMLGVGVGAIGAATMGGSRTAAHDLPTGPSNPVDQTAAQGPHAESLPVMMAGEQALYYGPEGMVAYNSGATPATVLYQSDPAYGSQTSAGWLGAHILLPLGCVLNAIDVSWYSATSRTGTVYVYRFRPDSGAVPTLVGMASVAAGSGIGSTSAALSNALVDGASAFSFEISQSSATWFRGARVRYHSPGGLFVPITPTRVYDSRLPMTPDASGMLTAGTNRTVSIADGRNPSTGTVTTPAVVPAEATALAYTLTVTDTAGTGYLTLNPGGTTAVTASTINWVGSALKLANSSAVKVPPARTVTVVCGGGATHFVIDAIGYYAA